MPEQKEQGKLEAAALQKFRPLAINLCHRVEQMRDENLLKWLRARDLNIKAAEEMLRKAMLWREENKSDDILAWRPPPQFCLDFPYYVDGEDREGNPVVIIPLGKWDVRRAYERGQKKLMLKYLDQILETVLEKARLKNLTDPGNTYVNQGLFIWDMQGLTARQMASTGMLDFCIDVCKRLEGQYAEIMKLSFPINAPIIFAWLFAVVKPILSKRTLSKITIYGSNQEKWKAELLKHISEDQLPEKYGGTRPILPEHSEMLSYTSSNCDDEWEDPDAGMLVLTVEPRDQVKIALDIKYINSTISWRFYTDDYDIGFSLVFEDKDLVILSKGRVDSHLKEESGNYCAIIPGRYLLVFDNTYSKYRSKTLYHQVEVTPPEGLKVDDMPMGILIKN